MDEKMVGKVNTKLRAAFSAQRAAVAKHDVEIPRRRRRMAGFLEKGQMDSFNSEARGLERTEQQAVQALLRAEKLNSEALAMAAMFGLTIMGTGADMTCMSAAALSSMQQLATGLQPGMLGGQPIAGPRAVAPIGVGVPVAAVPVAATLVAAVPVAAHAAAAPLPLSAQAHVSGAQATAVAPMFDVEPADDPMVQPLGRQDYGGPLPLVGAFVPPPPINPDYISLSSLPPAASACSSQRATRGRQNSELGRELLAEALRTTTACGMVKEGCMLKRGEGDASGFKRRFFRWCAVAEHSACALLPSARQRSRGAAFRSRSRFALPPPPTPSLSRCAPAFVLACCAYCTQRRWLWRAQILFRYIQGGERNDLPLPLHQAGARHIGCTAPHHAAHPDADVGAQG